MYTNCFGEHMIILYIFTKQLLSDAKKAENITLPVSLLSYDFSSAPEMTAKTSLSAFVKQICTFDHTVFKLYDIVTAFKDKLRTCVTIITNAAFVMMLLIILLIFFILI